MRKLVLVLLLLSLSNRLARADSCTGWPAGTLCQPDNPCLNVGTCDNTGHCQAGPPLVGAVCEPSANPCIQDSTCDGMGNCTPGMPRAAGTVCAASDSPCLENKICDGLGSCGPGMPLPSGTVCQISSNPCVGDSTCQGGVCTPGANKDGTTICSQPTTCRGAGHCNAGMCVSLSINEGQSCVGANPCIVNRCMSGACSPTGVPPVCFPDDPCLKKDACQPNVGCVPVNICDLMPRTDMPMSMPTDMAGSAVADMPASAADMGTAPDGAMPGGEMGMAGGSGDASMMGGDGAGARGDGAAQGDQGQGRGGGADGGGPPAGADMGVGDLAGHHDMEAGHGPVAHVDQVLEGGMCQCRAGQRTGSPGGATIGLLLLAFAWLRRRPR